MDTRELPLEEFGEFDPLEFTECEAQSNAGARHIGTSNRDRSQRPEAGPQTLGFDEQRPPIAEVPERFVRLALFRIRAEELGKHTG